VVYVSKRQLFVRIVRQQWYLSITATGAGCMLNGAAAGINRNKK
jgi:hypothetical protein